MSEKSSGEEESPQEEFHLPEHARRAIEGLKRGSMPSDILVSSGVDPLDEEMGRLVLDPKSRGVPYEELVKIAQQRLAEAGRPLQPPVPKPPGETKPQKQPKVKRPPSPRMRPA